MSRPEEEAPSDVWLYLDRSPDDWGPELYRVFSAYTRHLSKNPLVGLARGVVSVPGVVVGRLMEGAH